MKNLLPAILVLLSNYSFCQNWDASAIPDSMKKGAILVMREESKMLDIKSINKAYYKRHEVYTILNENGKDNLTLLEITDPFHSIEDFSVKMYDASGKLLKKYNKKDLQYVYAGDGLITDTKYNILNLHTTGYPVTIEYNSEMLYSGSIQYPAFFLQTPEQSLISGNYVVSVPADLDIRYKILNSNIKPEVKSEGNLKIYTWVASQMAALKYEEMAVSEESRYPAIIIAPNRFELDGVEGDMSTWNNFAKWYGGLSKSTINMDEEKKLFFNNLVKDAKTDREKAEIIYHYLQNNFRYVSIQLGIGGFRPFTAMVTDKNKYGDCKALTNYTQASLAVVGIKSYQALINGGQNKQAIDPSMSYNGFNHVILCVPNNKDTIWLECTSNSNDFGVLGSFTENKNALLITGDGGELIHTPTSKPEENTLTTKSNVVISSEGEATATVNISTTGEYKGFQFTRENKDNQKMILLHYFGFPEPDFFEIKNGNEKGQYKLNMEIEKLPSLIASEKMFINPRLYKVWKNPLPSAANRTQDVYFPNPFIKQDTTIYKLPAGYKPETLPAKRELNTKYGQFVTQFSFDEATGELTSICKLTLRFHIIPAADYGEMKTFFDSVANEYNSKIVIKKG